MSAVNEALARTVLLVERDIYPDIGSATIADFLASRRTRIRIDGQSCASPAGQAALVATAMLTAELGAAIAIEVPRVPTLGHRPPLVGAWLDDALAAALDGLIAPLWDGIGTADLTILLGAAGTDSQDGETVLRVTGDDYGSELVATQGSPIAWGGEAPYGGVAAGILSAAESFRAAMVQLARALGRVPLGEHRIGPPQRARLRLPPIANLPNDIGSVDVVSAGAITNNCLFTLIQVPNLAGQLRIFDDDRVMVSNLNRCPLFTQGDIDETKTAALRNWETESLRIKAIPKKLDAQLVSQHGGLADAVLVGVDHIPARWLAQSHAPGWVCVAGTSHFLALVTEHWPGAPCAGCMHPYDEPGNEPLPTISFVSAAAGLLQAYFLAARHANHGGASGWQAYPFSLAEPRGVQRIAVAPNPHCPVGCPSSRARAA